MSIYNYEDEVRKIRPEENADPMIDVPKGVDMFAKPDQVGWHPENHSERRYEHCQQRLHMWRVEASRLQRKVLQLEKELEKR